MYRMVRIIVGSLVDVGCGRLDASSARRSVARRKTALLLGRTAPAEGLYLDAIEMDDHADDVWP